MKDLLLYSMLRRANADTVSPSFQPLDAELARALLIDLEKQPLETRFPFLGVLGPALDHPDEDIAASAHAALSGAGGPYALARLISALNDSRPSVQKAAVSALRATSQCHPARFIHALFHPDPKVRAAAQEREPPPQCDSLFGIYLLADPASQTAVLERMLKANSKELLENTIESPIPLPVEQLPILLDLIAQGALPRSTAMRLLSGIPWEQADICLAKGRSRSPAQMAAIIDCIQAPAPPADMPSGTESEEFDEFDIIFDTMWEKSPPALEIDKSNNTPTELPAKSCFHIFWAKISQCAFSLKAPLRRRLLASILHTALQKRHFCEAAAGLCTALLPRFAASPWIDSSTRHRAISALYTYGARLSPLEDADVQALLEIDIAKKPDGKRDLWVIGGLLHWVLNHPYKRLIRWIPKNEIFEAFEQDPEYAAPLLCLKDESNRGRDYLLARLFERCPDKKTLIQALLVVISPNDELSSLSALPANESFGIAIELLRILERPGMRLSAKKLHAVAEVLGKNIAPYSEAFASHWLAMPAPSQSSMGLALFGTVTTIISAEEFIEWSLRLPLPLLRAMLAAIADCPRFPFGKELALARALQNHSDSALKAWARERIPEALDGEAEPVEARPTPRFEISEMARALEAPEYDAIARASKMDMAKALAPCMGIAHTGLVSALHANLANTGLREPSADICCALLGCHDPPRDIDALFGRYSSDTPEFLQKLEQKALRAWLHKPGLPLFGHAWLHRFEHHAMAFINDIASNFSNINELLHFAIALQSHAIAERIWESAARAFSIWRWRKTLEPLKKACSDALCETLKAALETKNGVHAANMLLNLVESEIDPQRFDAMKLRVSERLSDFSPEVNAALSRWIESRGILTRGAQKRSLPRGEGEELLRTIRSCCDLNALEHFCKSASPDIVTEAALSLLSQGEAGAKRILRALKQFNTIECANILIDSLPLWPSGPSLDDARAISIGVLDAPSELRFRLSLALYSMGETARIGDALAAACAPSESAWFRAQDWEALRNTGIGEKDLALGLAPSPHPNAYRPAVAHFLQIDGQSDFAQDGLRAFLLSDSERMLDLRRRAALKLYKHGDPLGFPILLEQCLDLGKRSDKSDEIAKQLLSGVPGDLVQAAIRAVLSAGSNCLPEMTAVRLLEADSIDAEAYAHAIATLFSDSASDSVRNAIVTKLEKTPSRSQKLRRLAEVFAWGIKTGRELTGSLFSVRMIGGSALGYTRFDANHIFITPLPILRNEPHAREVVEGLILHELGHHIYHRGDEAKAIWDKAQKQALFSLLNLVADEHLERNLRAQSHDYGNRFKRLAAYAFQHSAKEVPVEALLGALGGHAFSILSNIRLHPARKEGCVRIKSGPMLSALEKAGGAFARFVRALRMGLGNRHKDPKVERALGLMRGDLKARSMKELYEITLQLRDIFGWQTQLLEHFGSAEALGGSPADEMIQGEGISAAELEAEIERVLNPEKRKDLQSDAHGAPGRRWINISPDEEFTTISSVVKLPFNSIDDARYSAKIARHARIMRAYLENLGLQFVSERRRTSGRRFDPARTKDALIKGDPRILMARRLMPQSDLFIGVLIDCSGSMQTHDNIEKAKLFATLLAKAARGMPSVDLSLFGFNDDTLFDAGNAERCAVSGLVAGGGNNDAAALWHGALCARASRRKSRLLVMISDGLPTECSANALRALVKRLSNKAHIACAQIAVQPLVEVCFPHYVVLNESDPEAALRHFGQTIASLVRKTLHGG